MVGGHPTERGALRYQHISGPAISFPSPNAFTSSACDCHDSVGILNLRLLGIAGRGRALPNWQDI